MTSSLLELASTNSLASPLMPPLKIVGARMALDARTGLRGVIEIRNGKIWRLTFEGAKTRRHSESLVGRAPLSIDLAGYLVLPGLINAHDHLEFNLFPRLGHGPYSNSDRWAQDIYHPERSPLREQLAVPKPVRLWWGGIKNLLSGVTTVCQHNPYEPEIFGKDFAVRVIRRYRWAHSLAREKDVASAFRAPPRDAPFVIHLGEGTDERSRNEIFELDLLGALDSRTVIVHGVALSSAGHALLRKKGGALIWCPSSNFFTLGRTLSRLTLSKSCRVVLGSDSALTAQGDLLDEVGVAHRQVDLNPQKIYPMVTCRAAEVLELAQGEGSLKPGAIADLIAIEDPGGSPASALVKCSFRQIELVMLGGRLQLLSPEMTRRLPKECQAGLESLRVENVKRLIRAPLAWLFAETRMALGSNLRLAGRQVSA